MTAVFRVFRSLWFCDHEIGVPIQAPQVDAATAVVPLAELLCEYHGTGVGRQDADASLEQPLDRMLLNALIRERPLELPSIGV